MDDYAERATRNRAQAREHAGTCPGCRRTHEWFPCPTDYTLSHACPTCKAPAWTDCAAPSKRASQARSHPAERNRNDAQHAARQRLGSAHHRRDVGKAPYPEERDPRANYGTIDQTGRDQ